MQERTPVIGAFRRCLLWCRRRRRSSWRRRSLEETMLHHAGEDADYWRIQAVCAVSRR